jgi:AP-1 complex subunit gamma-1
LFQCNFFNSFAFQFIGGLALTALGNIGSADIARDLSGEIEKMMGNSNGYLRKKACLCAVRLVRKCPEMCEGLFPHLQSLLQDRTHGVLIGGLTLILEICTLYPRAVAKLQPLVPVVVRMLKNLVLSGYSPEYDVGGITDPFLQVKLLRVMRVLAADREDAAEQMSDILAQVATNTESTKTAGNAVLYECVLTIMGIPCEAGLRVLGVNILGRFLMNRDNNIRYVALNTLAKVAPIDATSVQRHRNTIVDCLRDTDISIRRRALDLIALLCTDQNVRVLAKEMLNYLSVSDPEFEPDLTEKLCGLVAKWAPSRKWHVDTMVRVLIIAGNSVPPSVLPTLVQLISSAPELQIYAVHKFFNAIAHDRTKPVLLQVAVWCIGEFGELLSVAPPGDGGEPLPTDNQVIDMVAELLAMDNLTLKGYCLNALVKLTTRLAHGIDRIKGLIAHHKGSVALDLQQRAVEYHALFNFDEIRRSVVETLPTNEDFEEDGAAEGGAAAERRQRQSLLDDDDEPAAAATVTQKQQPRTQPVQHSAAPAASSKSIMDDLLGLSMPTAAAPAPAKQQPSAMDLLAGACEFYARSCLCRVSFLLPLLLLLTLLLLLLIIITFTLLMMRVPTTIDDDRICRANVITLIQITRSHSHTGAFGIGLHANFAASRCPLPRKWRAHHPSVRCRRCSHLVCLCQGPERPFQVRFAVAVW